MKNKCSLLLVTLSITVLFSACGKINSGQTPSNDKNISSTTSDVTSEPSSTNIDEEENNVDEEETKTTEINISANSGYADEKHEVTVLGLKSYKKLDNGTYKDKAAKNKKYLVLFLEISNKTLEEDYINVNYLSAKVDGKEITNTVLFNEPEGYQTIFDHVGVQDTLKGFVVWEVPKDWKKIEIKYSGWEDIDNLNINCSFTPDDYFDPPQYE